VKTQIALLCAVLFCSGRSLAQLGANCGEHPSIFRDRSGIVWFTPEQLEKMTIRRIEPVMPRSGLPPHYDNYITFRILVATNGDIGCIWEPRGNALYIRAVNEALQYWRFKPILLDGEPVEYVGVVKFHVRNN
jgi:hypothetical protein